MAGLVDVVRGWFRRLGGEPSASEVSALVKREAEKQPITIQLSGDQLEAMRDQWRGLDPSRPAAILFEVDGRPVADFKVASCPYFADTCCA